MKHIRRSLLESLRTQLETIPEYAGVWIRRIGPARNAFPSITLYAEAESVDTLTVHVQPRPQQRVVTIAVNVWIKGTVDAEKAESDMDAAAVAVEAVLTKPSLATDMLLIGSDFKVDEEEPEIHAVTLTYHIYYDSTEFTPTV